MAVDIACNSILAGTRKECAGSKHMTGLQRQCMLAKFELECPIGNWNSSTPPNVVTEASVLCEPCDYNTRILDADPRSGYYWISLEWGSLKKQAEGLQTSIDESMLDGYMIFIVDRFGNKLEGVATVPKKPMKKCCSHDTYSATISGALPENYSQFVIVPYQGNFSLPIGTPSDDIVDVVTGEARLMKGDVTITVEGHSRLDVANNPLVWASARLAIADTIQDVTVSMVQITDILAVGRRLTDNSGTLGGQVKITYEILLPQSYGGADVEQSSISTTTLMEKLNVRMAQAGISYRVKAVTVSTPTKSKVGDPVQQTAGARLGSSASVPIILALFNSDNSMSSR